VKYDSGLARLNAKERDMSDEKEKPEEVIEDQELKGVDGGSIPVINIPPDKPIPKPGADRAGPQVEL
jgi:hypothetical protein